MSGSDALQVSVNTPKGDIIAVNSQDNTAVLEDLLTLLKYCSRALVKYALRIEPHSPDGLESDAGMRLT